MTQSADCAPSEFSRASVYQEASSSPLPLKSDCSSPLAAPPPPPLFMSVALLSPKRQATPAQKPAPPSINRAHKRGARARTRAHRERGRSAGRRASRPAMRAARTGIAAPELNTGRHSQAKRPRRKVRFERVVDVVDSELQEVAASNDQPAPCSVSVLRRVLVAIAASLCLGLLSMSLTWVYLTGQDQAHLLDWIMPSRTLPPPDSPPPGVPPTPFVPPTPPVTPPPPSKPLPFTPPPPCGPPHSPIPLQPPAPLLPPLTAEEVVALLNHRFEQGRPSNDSPGLFVRVIDHLTDMDDWGATPWLRSSNPKRADRFSGSVINRIAPAIFMGKFGRGVPGFVLSSAAAQASLLCSFTHDAGSVMAICDPPGVSANCTPGCMGASAASRNTSHWCDSPAPCHGLGGECHVASGGRFSFPTCPWPAEKLDDMLAAHEREIANATCECCNWSSGEDDCSLYNELIFDSARLDTLRNIEAVFFPADRVSWVENLAREVHGSLRRHGVQVPLVQYNALVDRSGPAFTLADR